ncbi:MAG: hypothetical protein K9L64_06100, partial [Candidatus Izimaplasma sp.]|nr:hypothetical protein [Candidatus Izimaplasma bacterium]
MKYIKLLKKPKIYVSIILIMLVFSFVIINRNRVKEPTMEMSKITSSDAFDDYYNHVKETWDSSIVDDFNQEISADQMIGQYVSGDDYGNEGTLIRIDDNQTVEMSFNLTQAGIYQIAIKQRDISTSILPNAFSIKVNGAYPYEEAKNIELTTFWRFSKTTFSRDRYGNEILPDSEKTPFFHLNYLYDSTALNSRPLQFELEQGLNTIEIIHENGDFLVESLVITGVENIPTYEDYLSNYDNQSMGEENIITIGAESFISKSNPSTRLTSINDPSATAYDAENRLLNAIEGYSFRSGNDTIVYQVDIEEEGFYYLSFKYRQ